MWSTFTRNDVAKFDFLVLLCSWLISPDDSETSDLYLLLQVLLCLWTVEHPFSILENSTLRRDWNFFFALAPSLPGKPTCRLEALSITGLLVAIGLITDEELVGTELNLVFFFLFLHPFRHPLGAANQAEIFGTAESWNGWRSLQRKWRNRWVDSSHCYFCRSVSTEQSQICAKNWIQIQEIKPKVRFVNL